MCNAVLQQPGAFYWMVHDSSNIDPYSVTAKEYIKGGYLFRADTLEELAALINVDPATLVATVNAYNEAVDKGVDELTGRTLLVAKIEQAPFFAGARVPSAHHTMGGVQIDDQAHVLNEKGEIIPGLLAAGEVCGDIHGGNRVGGNAVVDTVVYGRIAGNTATTK
jgi:fumarate reductase flavoprotein subunit